MSSLRLLEPAAEEPWIVTAAVGEEALSELFSFRITFLVPHPEGAERDVDAFVRDLLGSQAELTLEGPRADPESVPLRQSRSGIIATVHDVGVEGKEGSRSIRVDCTLVPRAFRLTLRKRSHIFHDKVVHEIVSEVLMDHGVPSSWSLTGRPHPRRHYCTQYMETDYDFVKRLLAEEGFAFRFDHAPHDAAGSAGNDTASAREGTADAVGGGIAGAAGVGLAFAGSGTPGVAFGALGLVGDALRGPEADPDHVDEVSNAVGSAGVTTQGDVFCFFDDPRAYIRNPSSESSSGEIPSLALRVQRQSSKRSNGDELFCVVASRRMAPEAVEQRDHDFRRPLLQLRAAKGLDGVDAALAPVASLEAYEHHGDYDPPHVTGAAARARLDQHRADAQSAAGRSMCPKIFPGRTVRLKTDGYPTAPPIASGEYAVVRVRHAWFAFDTASAEALGWEGLGYRAGRSLAEGSSSPHLAPLPLPIDGWAKGYKNDFEFVPPNVLYGAPAPCPRPRATCQTAVVVGPPGKEIHTDRLGRVKVQFHWDREGRWTDGSSFWVRVVQPWTGSGYGFQFIPRVGTEVLVTFVGGDPDRPVVTGCLYDGTHPTPEPLPERATRSAIRTQSSPGGGGFNEIVFEDERHRESLSLRAQRELEVSAKGGHTLTVGEDQRVLVGRDQELGITGDRNVAVGGGQRVQIGEHRSETVGGDATSQVNGCQTERIHGGAFRSVAGLDVHVAEKDDVTVVGGTRSVSVKGNAITHVGGSPEKSAGHAIAFVNGDVFLSAMGAVQVSGLTTEGEAASKIRLSVGTSEIVMTHDTITLNAANIVITGSTSTTVTGKGHNIVFDDHGGVMKASPAEIRNSDGTCLRLAGKKATLVATDEVKLKSASIKLASGSGRSSSTEDPAREDPRTETKNLKLELTYQHFVMGEGDNPEITVPKLTSVPCRATFGTTVMHCPTTAEGVLELVVPDDLEELEVAVLIDEVSDTTLRDTLRVLYQQGPLVFRVKLVDEIPAASSARGKQLRLQNLGYDSGSRAEPVDLADPDDATASAIERFQLHQDLLEHPELDADTERRLQQLFGA